MQNRMEKGIWQTKNMPTRKLPTNAQSRKKCQIHTKYHCRSKNVNKNLNQTTQRKIDRRTIQGRGTHDTPENIYKDRITCNP